MFLSIPVWKYLAENRMNGQKHSNFVMGLDEKHQFFS